MVAWKKQSYLSVLRIFSAMCSPCKTSTYSILIIPATASRPNDASAGRLTLIRQWGRLRPISFIFYSSCITVALRVRKRFKNCIGIHQIFRYRLLCQPTCQSNYLNVVHTGNELNWVISINIFINRENLIILPDESVMESSHRRKSWTAMTSNFSSKWYGRKVVIP